MDQDEIQWERTKLSANYWNGLAVAFTGAALAALPISLLSQPQNQWVFNIMYPTLLILGVVLHRLACSHLRAPERARWSPNPARSIRRRLD